MMSKLFYILSLTLILLCTLSTSTYAQSVKSNPPKTQSLSLSGTIIHRAGEYYLQQKHQDVLLPSDPRKGGGSYAGYLGQYVTVSCQGYPIASHMQRRSSIKNKKPPTFHKVTSVTSIQATENPELKKIRELQAQAEKKKQDRLEKQEKEKQEKEKQEKEKNEAQTKDKTKSAEGQETKKTEESDVDENK